MDTRQHASAYNSSYSRVGSFAMFTDLNKACFLLSLEILSKGSRKHLSCMADNRGLSSIMLQPNRGLSAHPVVKQRSLQALSLSSPSNVMLLFEYWKCSRRYTPPGHKPFLHLGSHSFTVHQSSTILLRIKLEFLVFVRA